MREHEPPAIQKDFLVDALAEGKRLDGRSRLEQRPFTLTFGPELGSVECRLGKTACVKLSSVQLIQADSSVLAQVTATIVKPRDDKPYEGFLLINSEISPMASCVFEAGR